MGDVAPLRQAYADLVGNFGPADGPVNVLEIGAGGGRSTAVLLEVLGDRAGDYHVVDVSARFVEVLKERIAFPVEVHIVDDVDLSTPPADHFDLASPSRRGRTSGSTTSTATFVSFAG